MLSISTALKGAASARYYLKGEQVGYYANADGEPGRWAGMGAARLELDGRIEILDLLHLWAGFSPDGRTDLVRNAGSENRDAAWDLTFSDPKSVSVLWGLGTPETRKAIDRARDAALRETLSWLEQTAGFSRRGKGGQTLEPAELVFAVFDHRTSRNLDPNTHAHALLLNVGVREDGSTGALVTEEVFAHKMEAGERYRTALERHLIQELPLRTEKRGIGFHIAGVPEDLCEHLSSRRREILHLMGELGFTGAVAAKVAALDTRSEKRDVPQEALFGYWKKEAERFGWSEERVFIQQERVERHREDPVEQPVQEEKTKTPDEAHQNASNTGSKREQRTHSERNRTASAKNAPGRESRDEGEPSETHQTANERAIRLEWRYAVPNAPSWSPVSKWKLPVIVVGRKQPRWGRVVWRRRVGNVVLKYQEKFLFPNAPRWSPMHKVSLRAFRVQTVGEERRAGQFRQPGGAVDEDMVELGGDLRHLVEHVVRGGQTELPRLGRRLREPMRRRALHIGIDQRHAPPLFLQPNRQMHGQRGLAHPSLLIGQRDDHLPPPRKNFSASLIADKRVIQQVGNWVGW